MRTLTKTEKASIVKLNANDIANLFSVSIVDGLYVFNVNKTISFTDPAKMSPNYFKYYKVLPLDTLTNISYKIYGTIGLWWLIAKINGITDATYPLVEGDLLKILKSDIVESIKKQIG